MRKLEHLSDEEIEKKLKEWDLLLDEAMELPTLDMYTNRIEWLGKTYGPYQAEKNFRKKPTFKPYSDLDLKCRMPLEKFVKCCKDKYFTSYDGFGYFASDEGVTNIDADTDDIREDNYRKDFPYVCW